jgi:hypothetical protein
VHLFISPGFEGVTKLKTLVRILLFLSLVNAFHPCDTHWISQDNQWVSQGSQEKQEKKKDKHFEK